MAIQDRSLSSAEHDYFATRSGEPANAPTSQHKRAYIEKNITAPANSSLIELERLWLQQFIPSESTSLPALWEEMAAAQLTIVSKDINENRFNFYTSNISL